MNFKNDKIKALVNQTLNQVKTYALPLQRQVQESEYWKQAEQRWKQLTKREQLLLMGTGALTAVLIFYQLIYSPISTAITRYQQDVINDQELLVFMKASVPRLLAATGQSKPEEPIRADMFLPTVESSLTADGMMEVVTSMSLSNDNTISIQFDAVELDGLLGWLIQIRKKYGIQVDMFSARPVELPGFASATVQLKLMGS